jgi:hypothetical protein
MKLSGATRRIYENKKKRNGKSVSDADWRCGRAPAFMNLACHFTFLPNSP